MSTLLDRYLEEVPMIISNVKKLMEEAGMTYAELQNITGLDSKTITRARGALICECKLSTLEKIARALNVKIVDLFVDLPEQ